MQRIPLIRTMLYFWLGLATAAAAPAGAGWKKFVAPDGSFSFHYPAGWNVSTGETAVTITHPATQEEMLVVALRFEPGMSPAGYAQRVLQAMQGETPDLRALNARQNESSVVFELAYSRAGRQFAGCGLVVRNNDTATWFSYSVPAGRYNSQRGMDLLRTLLGSIARGPGSQPPGAAVRAEPPAAAAAPARASAIAGTWSTSRAYGAVADAVSGVYRRGVFSGEVYSFRENGTFRYVMAGSGQAVSGMAIEEGSYGVDGNVVTTHAKRESWQPDPSHPGQRQAYRDRPAGRTRQFVFTFRDARTLVLRDARGGMETVLYKQPAQ